MINLGIQIDTQTHQNPMPKQVPRKTMKIIKDHLFLLCESMEFPCTNQWVLKVSKVAYANGINIKQPLQIIRKTINKLFQKRPANFLGEGVNVAALP